MAGYDASASALGFIHQIRWALCELLRRARDDASVRLSIEVFDDVALEDESGVPLKAVQLKQHESSAPLTDKSVDLWKTLRVWLDTAVLADEQGPELYLVTTAPIAPGSAAGYLGADGRDPVSAEPLLSEAATSSTADTTAAGRSLWLGTPKSKRLDLLRRVHIVGSSPRIESVDLEIRKELSPTVWPKHLDLFLEHLYGWWDNVCIKILQENRNGNRTTVGGSQLQDRIRTLRDDFTADALPLDPQLGRLSDEEIEEHYSKCFVEQLKWINVHGENLRRAVIDFHHAFTQTTRWLQDGDLVEDDLTHYEQELRDEWAVNFEDMCDRLEGEGVADPRARALAGRQLFQLLRDSTAVGIRKGFAEVFHARGTRHLLSDSGRIGWHPEFEGRVRDLLGQVGTA